MENNQVLDDIGDAKTYLEEVMGIVEDEEFNRERRKKLNMSKEQETDLEEDGFDYEPAASGDTWCCTKIFFFLVLAVFLTSTLLVVTNYKEDDSLGLRKMIQEDSLGIGRLGLLFDSHGFQLKELNNLPRLLLNGVSSLISEMKPIMSKLWYFFEQKWLTPSVRVYKDNFPFLKNGDKVKQAPIKEAHGGKQKQEKPFVTNKKEDVVPSDTRAEDVKQEDEKIKDFKRLQEKRRISSKEDIRKEEKKVTKKEIQTDSPKKMKDDFGSFVHTDL